MVKEILCFAIGAAAGFGTATYLMKTKYEAMVEEETKSAMEWVKNKGSEKDKDSDESMSHSDEVNKYNEIAPNYNTIAKKVEETGLLDENEPYRISEGDYLMDDDEYGKVSLDYYSDDHSLYEDGEFISNIEDVVGSDNLEMFKSIDEDVMYVRNEKFKIDYEICKIIGSYSEGMNYV